MTRHRFGTVDLSAHGVCEDCRPDLETPLADRLVEPRDIIGRSSAATWNRGELEAEIVQIAHLASVDAATAMSARRVNRRLLHRLDRLRRDAVRAGVPADQVAALGQRLGLPRWA